MTNKALILIACILFSFLYFGNDLLIKFEDQTPSVVLKKNGTEIIQNAKRMPSDGSNFHSYSRWLSTIGRTHVHNQLRTVLLESYKNLEITAPQLKWIYAETGWKNGGHFWPHKTHRNGLCVDFIVPVINQKKLPTTLFLWPFNGYGYKIRFNEKGIYKHYTFDFRSIILHINSLKESSAKHGLCIKRIILDPPLLRQLRNEPTYKLIEDIPFMEKHAWFPHDAHYHIDFAFKQ